MTTCEEELGSTLSGNLGQYKVPEHVGHSYAPCPYSTQSDSVRSKLILGFIPSKVDHTDNNGTVYYMKTASRGSWGYECTYPGCPYILAHNIAYFYR